jgi:parallel beta-helix repeat protein
MRLAAAAFAITLALAGAADARTWRVRPGPNAQQELQTALIEAQPGDTVRLDRGIYELTQGLSLSVDRVTIRGEGSDRTVLNFAGQRRGAEGLLVTADGVLLRDFAVVDARGDAIKVRDCEGITFDGIRAEWSRGPHQENGAYGLYPVNCTNVLIQNSVARGASDAGIYVGQSRNIIVRDSLAEYNVAGIEIENSYNADVFNNTAQHNTGGVLVFDLPGLPQKGGHSVRVFRNTIINNDTPNFAPAGNIVATVPTGTGVLIMANRDVHVFDNTIADNGTTNVIVTSYRAEFDDREYNPLPRNIMIRNNRFGNAGFAPAGDFAALTQMGVVLPDVIWDGATMFSVGGTPRTESVRIVLRDNRSTRTGTASFLSLGLPVAGSPLTEAAPDPSMPPLMELAEPAEVRIRD